MEGPGRAQDLNYLNYLIPGPELNNLNNLNIGGGGGSGEGPGGGPGKGPGFKLFKLFKLFNSRPRIK